MLLKRLIINFDLNLSCFELIAKMRTKSKKMQIITNVIRSKEEVYDFKNLHSNFVKNTKPGEIVINKTVLLCHINEKISRYIKLHEANVYISSKMLKHLYDKRSAQEYDCLLRNMYLIAKYPDLIYRNKGYKSGDFLFVKAIDGYCYTCSLQFVQKGFCRKLNLITAFSVKPEYMRNFKLLWSWKSFN